MKISPLIIAMLVPTFWVFAQSSSPQPSTPHPSTQPVDIDVIKKFPKKFVRKGDSLTLKFSNGKSRVFKDDLTDGERYIRSTLIDFQPEVNVAVIERDFYEGGEYLVISLKTGSEINVPGRPLWSPNKHNFVSVSDDESGESDNANVAVIGKCQLSKCLEVYKESTHGAQAKWIDNKTVEFEKINFNPADGTSIDKMFTCKLGKKVVCEPKP